MANSPQAKKRARQAEKSRQHNASLRSMVRTYLKKVKTSIDSADYAASTTAFQTVAPIVDAMVNKGIYTKNKAARIKSRLNTQIKALNS